jgi:hypothetical protein
VTSTTPFTTLADQHRDEPGGRRDA